MAVKFASFRRRYHAVIKAIYERLPVAQECHEQPPALALMIDHALPETLDGFENEAIKSEDGKPECVWLAVLVHVDQSLRRLDKSLPYAVTQDVDCLQPAILFRVFGIEIKVAPELNRVLRAYL
ncbi:hypothetical protein [Rhizobium sp. WYCCWR 11146]|uniref:hypothetical protein n=1 Tax=Rhizobium sp. WYCCWR 11146 TaxID=2749833 RepID=UPI0015E781DE|nr:hypothetical protein [Rhizobium sp. WYCCWR 11146]MBA1343943.1 hypothetical protein [Rhizobium sp. WYCCWR 11146]